MNKLLGKVSVPTSKKNNIVIEKFTVDKLGSAFSFIRNDGTRGVESGEYTRLIIKSS